MTPSHCSTTAVPVGNLRSEILVVQSAQNWHRQRATDSLDGTWDRRIWTEYQPIRRRGQAFAAATTACCGMPAVTSGEAWWGELTHGRGSGGLL